MPIEEWVENMLPFWLIGRLSEDEVPSVEHMRQLAKRTLEVTEDIEAFRKIFPKNRSPEELKQAFTIAQEQRESAKKILAS